MAEQHARTYSILDPGNFAIVQERDRAVHAALVRNGYRSLEDVRIFEAGCGSGYNLRMFLQWGCPPEQLAGIDIDEGRVSKARELCPTMCLSSGSAEAIPEPDQSFDISIAFTLFSSVPTEQASRAIAAEIFRVTRPGGLILVYDMRRKSPRNPAVHPVSDGDIERWFPLCRRKTSRLTLVPPVARAVCARTPALYGPLSYLPFARTHSLHAMRRPALSPIAGAGGAA